MYVCFLLVLYNSLWDAVTLYAIALPTYMYNNIIVTVTMQAVSAGMVTTAMSNKRKVSFFSPDPVSYAREAVATIGIQGYTHGCWGHALQVYNIIIVVLQYWSMFLIVHRYIGLSNFVCCRDYSVAPVDMKWRKVLFLDKFTWWEFTEKKKWSYQGREPFFCADSDIWGKWEVYNIIIPFWITSTMSWYYQHGRGDCLWVGREELFC